MFEQKLILEVASPKSRGIPAGSGGDWGHRWGGSSYNFAAPVYHRLLAAVERGDLAAARAEQFRSVQLIELLAGFGYMEAAKAVMGFLSVEVGPARLPNTNLTPEQKARLRASLERLGFFQWVL